MKLHDYGSWCKIEVVRFSILGDPVYNTTTLLHLEYLRTRDKRVLEAKMLAYFDQYPSIDQKTNTAVKIEAWYWYHQAYHQIYKFVLRGTTVCYVGEFNR